MWPEFAAQGDTVRRVIGLWAPLLAGPWWMAPALALGALLALVLISGVALLSLGMLLTALLTAHLLLESVFGLSVSVVPS
ncbi:MAG: hypothetical protein A3J75_00490 [Acidobacteria bacterium RBG_16_68_9]|nr:MAG: hypothetical protein A3J75_00490 [Acidobacteria bacterium RBG_16_68_9]